MLAKRIIPCLDVHAGRVVKGVNFLNLRDAGDPVDIAARYEQEGADELVFLDITASHEERDIILDVVQRTSEVCFMPLTVGGGIRTLDDIRRLLKAGCDKVSINSAAVKDPEFVRAAARRFGSQCIVVNIDPRRVESRELRVESSALPGHLRLVERPLPEPGSVRERLTDQRRRKHLEDQFAAYLVAEGRRQTNEQSIFARVVSSTQREFDVEELILQLAVRPEGAQVRRSTIYRSLLQMEEAGLIEKSTGDGGRDVYKLSTLNPQLSTCCWDVHINGGRKPTGIDAVAWAQEVERLGAGEIVLTSMDADGTKDGYDLEITRAVVDAVEIPVVASGGCGSPEHMRAALMDAGASAALAASIFHYGEYTIGAAKQYLHEHGVPVRLTTAD